MINKKVVFILGAGAHCPYGFPSGKKLKSDIISVVEASHRYGVSETSLCQVARLDEKINNDVSEKQCKDFVDALNEAGQPSIDAFLHANRHRQFDTIGKTAIAQVLLDYDSGRRIGHTDVEDDWLSYLFEKMVAGVWSAQEFVEKNPISFITFNYDTYLERWLYKKIKYSYGLSDKDAREIFLRIPIFHVYGSLGDPFDQFLHNPSLWMTAYKRISTIYDNQLHERSEIEKIKSLLAQSEVICMLGCGFHPENLQVINLPDFLKNNPRTLIVSRFGLNDAELDVALRAFAREAYRPPFGAEIKCVETLKRLANLIF